MDSYPDQFESEEALSHPSTELIELIKELQGDILFLGVSGKMGISMACMAKRACDQAGVAKRIMGVSRFSESSNQSYLQEQGIETLLGDLLDPSFLNSLPEISNIVYLAGIKFGTESQEAYTWAMNAWLPGMVAEKFKDSCIVALSTGCVYPLVSVESGGSIETDLTGPVGEYAQSCLGRERAFEYGSRKHNTPGILVRLNYSVEIRYGVLVDVATKVLNSEPLDVSMGFANVIWQGDANDLILRCFNVVSSPALPINVTGAETLFDKGIGEQIRRDIRQKTNHQRNGATYGPVIQCRESLRAGR